jgi:hypothetical protein
LERTGVLKGFMIFLTATGWPVSWSLAELFHLHQREFFSDAAQGPFIPDEPESTHAHRLQIGVPDQRSIISSSLEGSQEGANLLVISNVVPKIWALTNSAILSTVEVFVIKRTEVKS